MRSRIAATHQSGHKGGDRYLRTGHVDRVDPVTVAHAVEQPPDHRRAIPAAVVGGSRCTGASYCPATSARWRSPTRSYSPAICAHHPDALLAHSGERRRRGARCHGLLAMPAGCFASGLPSPCNPTTSRFICCGHVDRRADSPMARLCTTRPAAGRPCREATAPPRGTDLGPQLPRACTPLRRHPSRAARRRDTRRLTRPRQKEYGDDRAETARRDRGPAKHGRQGAGPGRPAVSTALWILAGLAAWCALGVVTGLVIGPLLRRRGEECSHPSRLPGDVGVGDGAGRPGS